MRKQQVHRQFPNGNTLDEKSVGKISEENVTQKATLLFAVTMVFAERSMSNAVRKKMKMDFDNIWNVIFYN